jgi:2,3-bisphosphoglycerate-dependent phosphoglycerate mutase
MELLLVRHALPIRKELAEGAADPELDERGHSQAKHLATYLADERPLDAIYVSPMLRARQTAEPLAAHFGIEPVVVDDIAESDKGSSWYVPMEQLKAEGDPRWQALVRGERPDGWLEDPQEFRSRVIGALEEIVAANPKRKVAAVCHGGVINAYLVHVLNLELGGHADTEGFFYPNYTSIHRIMAASSGERSIHTVNETAHLRGTGLPVGMHSA